MTTPAATTTSRKAVGERTSSSVPRAAGDQRSDVSYATVDKKGKDDGTTKVKSKKGEYKVTEKPAPRDKSTNP